MISDAAKRADVLRKYKRNTPDNRIRPAIEDSFSESNTRDFEYGIGR